MAGLTGNTKRVPIAQEMVVRGLLVAILLLSFGLRLYRLGDKGIWFDEGWSTWLARKTLVGMVERTAYDTHPPLYFWVLHLWRTGSGDSEFGLRSLSVAIGTLGVAAAYLLGRKAGGPWTGVLAALLASISRFNIWWSQEVRMYALAALLATLSLWAAIRLWDRGRPLDGVAYVLVTTAGLYTLYLFALVLVVINLVWLWVLWRAEDRRRELARWVPTQLMVLLLFAPWLLYALERIPTWSVASPVTLGQFLRIYGTVLTVGISVNVEDYLALVVPVLLVFLVSVATLCWAGRRDWRVGRNTVLLLVGILLPAAMVYLISLPREPFFYSPQLAPRYMLVFAPSFYVLLAWGLVRTGAYHRWLLGALLTLLVVGVALFGLWHYYPERILVDDYRSLASTLRAYRRPDDAVVLYTDKDWPVFDYHVPAPWVGIPYAETMTPGGADHYLSPVWEGHEGVWLVINPYARVNDPEGNIPGWLAERAAGILEYHLADKILRLYTRSEERASEALELAPGAEPSYGLQVDMQPGLRLSGYDRLVRELQPGDTLHLFLYFRRVGELDTDGKGLEVSLRSSDGQVWTRIPVPWPFAANGTTYVRKQVDILIPPDAPEGTYALAAQSLSGSQTASVGRILVRGRQASRLAADDVSIAVPLKTSFAEGIQLLGYEVGTAILKPGDTLSLTLYWQAQKPVQRRYKVFTHLLGEFFNPETGNFLWGQQDNEPVNDARPTSTWRTGEVIVDSYRISLATTAPAGLYIVEVGLYDPPTGARLPVVDEEGHTVAEQVHLTSLTVEGK